MKNITEAKRCPFCMVSALYPVRQTWSFKENSDRTIPIVEIHMLCEACEKPSVWQWVVKE